MVKLTIDGQSVEVPQGTTLINAAQQVGTTVPRYCYHPGLSIAGNCRICMVDVEGMPKTVISCHTEARDGMVVHTQSEKAKKSREAVLEFLLANHPLDCPVCDQSGECKLQDYYMEHGLYNSKFMETKVKKTKAVVLGPTVILDTERCVLCSVCTRYCEEITKTHELGIFNSGDHAIVGLYPGKELDNKYSGNVVDICPVGALTDRDFRFKCRVWYLAEQESVCNGCARGCNIKIHWNQKRPYQTPGERVMRLKPRYNPDVNQWWMCDAGRYGYKAIDQNRLTAPLKREDDVLIETSWDVIEADLIDYFKTLKLTPAKSKFAVLASPQLTNEDLFVLKGFCEEIGIEPVTILSPNPEGDQDDFLIRADKNPNTKGARTILGGLDSFKSANIVIELARNGKLDGLLIMGQDLKALFGNEGSRSIRSTTKTIIYLGSHRNDSVDLADYALPAAVYAEKEGTFTNFEGRVQRIQPAFAPLGSARGDWEILGAMAHALSTARDYQSSQEVFEALAHEVPAFEGLTYDKIGSTGALIMAAADKTAGVKRGR